MHRSVFCSLFRVLAAVVVFSSLLCASVAIFSGTLAENAYAANDTWYVGEGAAKGLWVKYGIQEFDTNNGRPFEMTIWFKDQDPDGTWTAPVWVVDEGKVINGTLKLQNNLAAVSAGANIPEQMSAYIGAYKGSLQWLEGFTTKKEPLSLNQASWGKIAAIGGAEVKPMGSEKVTVPAGTFDTTVVGWYKSVQNKIWILNEFPYPIKAETFAEVSTGQPPTLFAFELLDRGNGQPPIPQASTFAPQPPLKESTGRGTYTANLDWSPSTIQPGSEVTFRVSFTNSIGNPLERVNYDFTAKDANGDVIKEFTNQNTDPDTGVGQQTVKFDKGGRIQISVTINTIQGRLAGGEAGFLERSDFDIVVVPEFPPSVAIIAALALAISIVALRFPIRRQQL